MHHHLLVLCSALPQKTKAFPKRVFFLVLRGETSSSRRKYYRNGVSSALSPSLRARDGIVQLPQVPARRRGGRQPAHGSSDDDHSRVGARGRGRRGRGGRRVLLRPRVRGARRRQRGVRRGRGEGRVQLLRRRRRRLRRRGGGRGRGGGAGGRGRRREGGGTGRRRDGAGTAGVVPPAGNQVPRAAAEAEEAEGPSPGGGQRRLPGPEGQQQPFVDQVPGRRRAVRVALHARQQLPHLRRRRRRSQAGAADDDAVVVRGDDQRRGGALRQGGDAQVPEQNQAPVCEGLPAVRRPTALRRRQRGRGDGRGARAHAVPFPVALPRALLPASRTGGGPGAAAGRPGLRRARAARQRAGRPEAGVQAAGQEPVRVVRRGGRALAASGVHSAAAAAARRLAAAGAGRHPERHRALQALLQRLQRFGVAVAAVHDDGGEGRHQGRR